MTISGTRSALYRLARLLGDWQAVRRAARTDSAAPIERRLLRRAYGRATGRLARRLFR